MPLLLGALLLASGCIQDAPGGTETDAAGTEVQPWAVRIEETVRFDAESGTVGVEVPDEHCDIFQLTVPPEADTMSVRAHRPTGGAWTWTVAVEDPEGNETAIWVDVLTWRPDPGDWRFHVRGEGVGGEAVLEIELYGIGPPETSDQVRSSFICVQR